MRHDIDGRPVEPLSAADRLAAQKSFLDVKRQLMHTSIERQQANKPHIDEARAGH
jgi:hypothetical protein